MRRYAFAAVVALAACLLAPASGSAMPIASVKVSSCSRLDHTAAFYGRMAGLAGAERMAMRFTLLVRGDDERYVALKAPGLSRWRKSKPDVRAFGYRQRTKGLTDGLLYRMEVEYRWYDEDGVVIRKARRRSRACSQAGPLPNLRVRITEASPTAIEGVTRYRVRVANGGSATASDVAVSLAVDGSAVDTRTLASLAPGEFELVTFRGPSCGAGAQAVVDPSDTVRETAETDNTQSRTCAQLAP